jgi:hypothetical protein
MVRQEESIDPGLHMNGSGHIRYVEVTGKLQNNERKVIREI